MQANREVHLPPLLAPADGLAEWARRRVEITARIRAVAGRRPAGLPAPAPRELDRVRFAAYDRLLVEFTLDVGETAAAYLYLPHAAGPVPGVIAFHQTADDGKEEVAGLTAASPQMAYAPVLAEAGFAVLSFDDVAAGERVRPGRRPYDTADFYARHPGWSALDKSVCDARQALGVLAAAPGVDPARLGAVGHSQGGIYAWMLAADDERVKAAVANCGFSTLTGDDEPERWARDSWYVAMPGLREGVKARAFPFDFHEWAALAAPRALLLMGARQDATLPNWRGFEAAAGELAAVYRLYGAGAKLKTHLFEGEHAFPAREQALMLAFLRENL